VAFGVELSEYILTLDYGAGMHFGGYSQVPGYCRVNSTYLIFKIERDTYLHNAFRYIFHYL
jgi:hypothetical protein